jgi:hypothetical protein
MTPSESTASQSANGLAPLIDTGVVLRPSGFDPSYPILAGVDCTEWPGVGVQLVLF